MKLTIIFLFVAICCAEILASPIGGHRSAMGRILDANKNKTNLDVIYGDIKRVRVQNALYQKNWRWPNAVMHYTIRSRDFTSSQIKQIKDGMADIESKTCVKFMEHSEGSAPRQYVEIIDDGACYSWVGRQESKQELSLATWGCLYHGTIVHELLHALGFDHEQNRNDRDKYVKILWENVPSGQRHNFELANTNSLGVPYDPKSVMQYENDAWSVNGGDTIQWIDDPKLRLGGEELTDMDVQQLNLYYECDGIKTTTTTQRPTTKTTTTKRPTTKTTTTKRPTTKTTTKGPTTKSTTTMRPTTESTTTETPDGSCGDKSFRCVHAYYYSSICDNDDDNDDVMMMCPQSCGLCGSESDPLFCVNFKDEPSFNCKRKAKRGHCTTRDYHKRFAMKTNCPKTCCEKGRLYW